MRIKQRATLVFAVVALVVGAAAPAFASHFRASNGVVSYDSGTSTLTWQINEAWRHGADDTFVGQGSTVTVNAFPADTASCASVTVTTVAVDTTDPLFDRVTESMSGDLSCLATGQYSIYATNCCRVNGVFNTSGNNSFSQRIVFTKNANGSIDMPPVFNAPSLYVMVAVAGPSDSVVIDYRATDPDATAVTYSQLTTVTTPDWGAAPLPCSTFSGGLLTIGPSLCVGAEDFATDYPAGRFYAAKVRATDANGNTSEVDTLLRVPTAPQPRVQSNDGGAPTGFTLGLVDSDTVTPSAWTLACTSRTDSAVVSGSAGTAGNPVITLALVPGQTYDCVPTATNIVGTGTGSAYVYTAVDHVPNPTIQTVTPGATTPFHVVQPTGGITTPTSWTVTCTNQGNGSDVVAATVAVTGMAADLDLVGLTFGATYDCVPTAVNGAGTGTGPTHVLLVDFARTPAVVTAVPGTSTLFALGLLPGQGSNPTGWSVVCTDDDDASMHSGTAGAGATADVTVAGLVAGHHYTCVPSATNAGGTAAGAPYTLHVPPADRGGYTPQAPERLADTRDGTGGAPVGKVGPGSVLRIPVRSWPGVPADVSAVTITVTTDNAAGPGFVTVYPCANEGVSTSNVNFEAGRQVANLVMTAVDADGDVCVSANGPVDIMVDLTGVFSSLGDRFEAVVPFRALDTRDAQTKVTPGQTVTVDFTGDTRLPDGASAVVLNVTATESDADGYVTVYPCGGSVPLASSLNLTPGREIPVLVTVKLPVSRQVCLYSQSGTHLVVDVTGYFAPSAEDHFVPVTPARLVDSRVGLGAEQRPLADGETLRVTIVGFGGVPAGATAASLNVTLTSSSRAGFLTAYPCDAPRPLASNVNAKAGSDTPNAVVIKVPTSGPDAGQVCLYTMVATDLIVDVTGYFTA